MANEFIKAERVVRTALGLLERDVTLPNLVWRDAAGDFRGAKGDTITIRLPAYFNANKRALRSGASKDKSTLHERAVDVTLTHNLYGVIEITDEELTLDIDSFNAQVTAPVAAGIIRGLEDELIGEIEGADYEYHLELADNPYETVVAARGHLNDSRVPFEGRALIVGSEIEAAFLTSDQFVKVDQSGSDSALREAEIGRVAGFRVFTIPGLAPDEGYAFHRTAYVLNQRAPFVPRGVAWGASESFQGFAVRVAQQVDPDELVDNFHADVFVGTNHVTDVGEIGEDGRFTPAEDPEDEEADEHFVRAVKISVDGPVG